MYICMALARKKETTEEDKFNDLHALLVVKAIYIHKLKNFL